MQVRGIVADNFAGGGGTSKGIELRSAVAPTSRSTTIPRPSLQRYNNGATGQPLQLPLGGLTTRDRFGVVMVAGAEYEIVDIGMRMLQPRELFRAQGFPDSYIIDLEVDGKPLTKTAQIRMCGNSVPPQMVAAIVGANVPRARSEAA